MTIRTYYYTHNVDRALFYPIRVTIVDKKIMPNKPDKHKHVADWFVVTRKTDYDIQWLYPTDPDYRPGHDIKITFCYQGSDQPHDFYLHLNWWQRRKMKLIWGDYWLFRGDNFRNFIFPFLIALFTGIATIYIKDYIDRHNQRDTDNRGEQPVEQVKPN